MVLELVIGSGEHGILYVLVHISIISINFQDWSLGVLVVLLLTFLEFMSMFITIWTLLQPHHIGETKVNFEVKHLLFFMI